ncbi:MAG: TonB-dependent receptor, partial [Acidimicrobiaceae bacterium]|nr:TonB-dependent receptor [Acidimicrobiaceae bacterium]
IIDDIQEFKVQSHNDSSAFGGSLGGIINVVTRGGTQNYHGDVWEFLRNSAFDARNTFNTSVTPYKQNQFGGAGGGPLFPKFLQRGKAPKSFVFAAYEGFRATRSAELVEVIPTQAELSGDFSADANPIYNPFTTRPDPNNPGQYLRDPFPSNQIPSSLINQDLIKYAKLFYPTTSQVAQNGFNFTDATPNVTNSNSFSMRADQQFTNQLTAWFRFAQFNEPSSSATGIPSVINSNTQKGDNFGGSATWSSSTGSKIISGRFGRTESWALTQNVFPGSLTNAWQTGGFNSLYATGYQGGRTFNPGQNISGYAGLPEGNYQGNEIANIWEGAADVTILRGRHTFQMGFDLNTNDNNQPILFVNQNYGSYQTSNLESSAATGNAFASYMLGLPNAVNRRNVAITTHGGWEDGFYFQDQWKATSKLQINAGLRYDVTFWPIYGSLTQGNQFVGDTDLDTGQYILARVPPACSTGASPCIPTTDGSLPANVVVTPSGNGSIIHNTFDNWQPRLGVTYEVKPGTVVRASGGRFFDNWAAIQQLATNYQGNWPDTNFLLKNNLNNTIPDPSTGQNPLGLGGAGSQILPAPTPFNQVNWMIDPYYKNAYSIQWNFGLEQAIGSDTVLEADYVGSHSSRLDSGSYRNTALYPGPGPITTYDNQGNLTALGTRQPFPYITPTYYDKSVANSNYNSFQFKARSRIGTKLTLLGSYTWSKTIDLGCDGFFGSEGCSVQNPYNLRADRSVAGFDIPQNLSVSYVYQLPIGQGQALNVSNRVLDEMIGEWIFSGIFTARSGQPFNNNATGDIPNTGNVVERADRSAGCSPYTSSKGRSYVNVGCFITPSPFTFGTEGRNDLRSPRVINLDLSLMKDFPLGAEARKLEFRADFFNAPNHQSLGVPDTTLTDTTFGQILSTAQTEREIQFALKIIF